MRVISGSVRGLKLNPPINNDIRPTTDRVKENMFNMINEYVYDSVVFDVFAGSGALGIEALSRGAKKAVFCDKSRESINVLNKNIDKARFKDVSEIINDDYRSAIKKLSCRNMVFDLIFVDPPYYEGLFEDVLSNIVNYGLLSEDGVIVVEHDNKDVIGDIEGLEMFKEKKYGITTLSFYMMEGRDEL